jgi:CBS domain containing-hemolysin-like protein
MLRLLNALATAVLKPFGVRPPDELAPTHGPVEMQMLFDRSRAEGLLEAEQSELLTSVLGLGSLRIAEVALPAAGLVTVPPTADATEIELASIAGGRSRLGVTAPDGRIAGVVHVREALRATTAGRAATAADLMDPVFTLDAGERVVDAVAAMRAGRAQVAMVYDGERWTGFVALEDLLEQVLGRFDDETDPVGVP